LQLLISLPILLSTVAGTSGSFDLSSECGNWSESGAAAAAASVSPRLSSQSSINRTSGCRSLTAQQPGLVAAHVLRQVGWIALAGTGRATVQAEWCRMLERGAGLSWAAVTPEFFGGQARGGRGAPAISSRKIGANLLPPLPPPLQPTWLARLLRSAAQLISHPSTIRPHGFPSLARTEGEPVLLREP